MVWILYRHFILALFFLWILYLFILKAEYRWHSILLSQLEWFYSYVWVISVFHWSLRRILRFIFLWDRTETRKGGLPLLSKCLKRESSGFLAIFPSLKGNLRFSRMSNDSFWGQKVVNSTRFTERLWSFMILSVNDWNFTFFR